MSKHFTRILLGLRRTTSSGRFLPEIDGVRFLSISWVVLFHAIAQVGFKLHEHLPDSHLWQIIGVGKFGVWIFFSLSGFILALPFAEWRICDGKPITLKRYYLRRLTRIEPPYLVNLAAVFALLPPVQLACRLSSTSQARSCQRFLSPRPGFQPRQFPEPRRLEP
jgi:peptidoglycan/LPS O-acetylase OafA/YrhL